MNINSRPLSLNMLANVDKFAGRLGCLERCLWAANSREIILVAEVSSKRCLRAADSREITLVASKRCLWTANSREITLVA